MCALGTHGSFRNNSNGSHEYGCAAFEQLAAVRLHRKIIQDRVAVTAEAHHFGAQVGADVIEPADVETDATGADTSAEADTESAEGEADPVSEADADTDASDETNVDSTKEKGK